jgi:hypothetical protein
MYVCNAIFMTSNVSLYVYYAVFMTSNISLYVYYPVFMTSIVLLYIYYPVFMTSIVLLYIYNTVFMISNMLLYVYNASLLTMNKFKIPDCSPAIVRSRLYITFLFLFYLCRQISEYVFIKKIVQKHHKMILFSLFCT